jgi:hypothetical protein
LKINIQIFRRFKILRHSLKYTYHAIRKQIEKKIIFDQSHFKPQNVLGRFYETP